MATLIKYPDNTNTVSGIVRRAGVNEPFADIRVNAGTDNDKTVTSQVVCNIVGGTPNPNYQQLTRSIFNFDTSELGAGATISAVKLVLTGSDTTLNNLGGGATVNVYGATPEAVNSLEDDDYGRVGSTPFCDSPIGFGDWEEAGENEFNLNAAGIAAINKTGVTSLGIREAAHDVAGTAPTTHQIDGQMRIYAYFSSNATGKPRLEITYEPAPNNSNFFNFI